MPAISEIKRVLAAVMAVAAGIGVLSLTACNEEPPASLYDASYFGTGAQPVITSIDPPGYGLAGVSVLNINGRNFSPVNEQNQVYFGKVPATVLQSSPTQLQVRAPVLIGDSIAVTVSVFKAALMAAPAYYRLDAAVFNWGAISITEEPWAIATDGLGYLYVSFINGGVGAGIKKISPDGHRVDSSASGGITKFSGMKVGPNGDIFGARSARALYRAPAAGGPPVVWMQIVGSTLSDLDFDKDGNLWTSGPGSSSLYRVKMDRTFKAFPFSGAIRTIRYFDPYIYVGGKTYPDSSEKVMRFRYVSADSIGPAEEYFNLSASAFSGRYIYTINFAADGELFIGTDGPDPIIRVSPAKVASLFYPGLFTPTIHQMAWGDGPFMYVVQGSGSAGGVGSSSKIFKVNMQKNGAPYYGRP